MWITLLTFYTSSLLIAEEITFEEKFNAGNKEIAGVFKNDKYIALSPLLSPRICFGIVTAKQNAKQRWIEYNYHLNGFYSVGLKTYGAAVTYNYFWNGTRNGFFTQLTIGFDYVYFNGLGISPGGSTPDTTSDDIEGLCPNLSSGFGYSLPVGNDYSLRLNWDIGLKWFLSNIYISFVW